MEDFILITNNPQVNIAHLNMVERKNTDYKNEKTASQFDYRAPDGA